MGNLTTKQKKDTSSSELADFGTPIQTKQYTELSKDQPDSASSRNTLWKNLFSNWDPRSPSQFINRTPMWKLRGSANHSANPSVEFTELMNDSVVSVNLEILTALEEEEMRAEAEASHEIDPDSDPRSPSTEITRTPILFEEKLPKEETLFKNLTKKLMTNASSITKVSPVEELAPQDIPKTNKLNLIYEDFEDLRFSTPPKKSIKDIQKSLDVTPRTPLSCLANKKSFANNLSSTPKHSGNNIFIDENAPPKKFTEEVQRSNSKIPVFRTRIN